MRHEWVYDPHDFGPWEWLGPLFMVIVLAILVVGIVLIVRALTSRHARTPDDSPVPGQVTALPPVTDMVALRILEERYARGEVDRDEFLQRRQDLLDTGRQSAPGVMPAQPPPAPTA